MCHVELILHLHTRIYYTDMSMQYNKNLYAIETQRLASQVSPLESIKDHIPSSRPARKLQNPPPRSPTPSGPRSISPAPRRSCPSPSSMSPNALPPPSCIAAPPYISLSFVRGVFQPGTGSGTHNILEHPDRIDRGVMHFRKEPSWSVCPDGYQSERKGSEAITDLCECGTDGEGGVDGVGFVGDLAIPCSR